MKLVKASKEYQNQIIDMMDEWVASGEKIVPYSARRNDYHEFDAYLKGFEDETIQGNYPGDVPRTTLWAYDETSDQMVGVVNIRHWLNEDLLQFAGHIGDGIRPSQRRKGHATTMIGLALEECRKLGISRALMVCDKENIGSSKSIKNNGGVLEDEFTKDGVVHQRYWIDIPPLK